MQQYNTLLFRRGKSKTDQVGLHVQGVGSRSGLPLSINCIKIGYEALIFLGL